MAGVEGCSSVVCLAGLSVLGPSSRADCGYFSSLDGLMLPRLICLHGGMTYRKLPTRIRLCWSRVAETGLALRDSLEGESHFISESRVVRTSLLRKDPLRSRLSLGGRRMGPSLSSVLSNRRGDSRRASLILRIPWKDMLNLSIGPISSTRLTPINPSSSSSHHGNQ